MTPMPGTCGECPHKKTALYTDYIKCAHPDAEPDDVMNHRRRSRVPPVDPRLCPLRKESRPARVPAPPAESEMAALLDFIGSGADLAEVRLVAFHMHEGMTFERAKEAAEK